MEHKFLTEDELVDKVQSGEFNWYDFVTHYSKEWIEEFGYYCKAKNLSQDNASAQQFLSFKQQQLEEALMNGDA